MKVLFMTSYIYEAAIPEFTRNKTGFGIMVNDIVESVAKIDCPFLLTHVITREKQKGNIRILNHDWKDVLSSMYIKDVSKGVKQAFKYKQSLKGRIRYLYYYCNNGYVRKVIKNLNPDIIHIHGIGFNTKPFIDVCEELGIPFIVTLHGLIGLNENSLTPNQEQLLEKNFLQESEIREIPITVISSGIKNRIIKNYNLKEAKNINVIANGINTVEELGNKEDIRAKYKIPIDNKIILVVSNVSKNKNQLEILKAMLNFDLTLLEKTTFLFLGNDHMDGALQEKIKKFGLEKNAIYCGNIDRENLHSYWTESSLNIIASFDEGFGLSSIEGFVYGVPTLMFSDLDAVEDIYHKKAILLVNNRSVESLAECINKALQISWDTEWIKKYSKKFSLEKMAIEYHNYYEVIINKKKRNGHN